MNKYIRWLIVILLIPCIADATYFGSGSNLTIGNQAIHGVKTFDSFPVSPSTEPTTDYQFANKIYVDTHGGVGSGDLTSVLGDTSGDIPILFQSFAAISDGDTTPDVASYQNYITANTASTTITDFDGAMLSDGRELCVLVNDSNTVIDLTSSGIEASNRTEDLTCDSGQILIFKYSTVDNQWHLENAPDAITSISSNGFIARIGIGNVAARTISAGNGISVTNGDGVSGNPSIAVDMDGVDGTMIDWGITGNQISAASVPLSTTNFDTNLSSSDDTVQKMADTLDELVSSASPTIQSGEPSATDASGWYLDTDDGDAFYVDQNIGVFSFAGTYVPYVPAPELQSGYVGITGNILYLTYNTGITQGAAYNDNQLDIDGTTTGNNLVLTYSTGNTLTGHVYTVGTKVSQGETLNLDFDGTANSLENSQGTDLAAISDFSITNNTDDTLPVIVASADSTHNGVADVAGTCTLTETNPASPAVTFTAVNATPTSGSCTGTYPNYSTGNLTPDGTSNITVTFAATDLAGNEATGTDLTQVFTYSSAEPNASIEYELDDSAANATVTATYGANGTYRVTTTNTNTSTAANTDNEVSGTGCFKLPDGGNVASNMSTYEEDGIFTIEVTVKGDGNGSQSAYPRMFDAASANQIMLRRYNSDTVMSLALGGSTLSSTITVDDMANGNWQQFRLVCDYGNAGDDVYLYQRSHNGTSWGAWSLKYSAASFTIPTAAAFYFYSSSDGTNSWGSSTYNYYADRCRIWDSAVFPE